MLVYPCGSSVYDIFFEGFTCIRDVHAHPCDVPKQGMTIPYYIESTCNMNQQTTWHNMTTIYAVRGQSIWHMELMDLISSSNKNMFEGFSQVLLLMVQKSQTTTWDANKAL